MTEKRKPTKEELDNWWKSLSPERKSIIVKDHKLKKTVQHHLNLIKERKLEDARKRLATPLISDKQGKKFDVKKTFMNILLSDYIVIVFILLFLTPLMLDGIWRYIVGWGLYFLFFVYIYFKGKSGKPSAW